MKLIEKIRYQVTIRAVADALDLKEGMLGFYCPFHEDDTGMLLLKETENRFSCSGCKRTGSAIDLAAGVLNKSMDEAVEWIAERFDITDDDSHTADLLSAWKSESDRNRPTLNDVMGKHHSPTVSETDLAIYRAIYDHAAASDTVQVFLEHKGFTPEQIDRHGFRFLEKPRILLMELESEFSRDQLDEAGLLDRNLEFIFQRHALLIPFMDDADRLVFLAGWDMAGGKHPIRFPRQKEIPVYHAAGHRTDTPLYLVEDLPGAFAFIRKAAPVVAIPGKVDPEAILALAGTSGLSCCGEKTDAGNRFNRQVLQVANESNVDCAIRETAPVFEDFLEYLAEKRK